MFKKLELMSRIIGSNNNGKREGGKRTVLESYSDNYASSAILRVLQLVVLLPQSQPFISGVM